MKMRKDDEPLDAPIRAFEALVAGLAVGGVAGFIFGVIVGMVTAS